MADRYDEEAAAHLRDYPLTVDKRGRGAVLASLLRRVAADARRVGEESGRAMGFNGALRVVAWIAPMYPEAGSVLNMLDVRLRNERDLLPEMRTTDDAGGER